VDTIQQRTFQLRNRAMDAVVALIADVKATRDAGRSHAELGDAHGFQRRAQFLLDFVEPENSTGFQRAARGGARARRVDRSRSPGAACAS
jgi:nitrite reductase (cytochrome c-552)